MGLDVYMSRNGEEIQEPATCVPDHLFKLGYFRSSYNGGGYNSVVGHLIGKDLYYIFENPEREYEFTPDWKQALKRAKEVLKLLEERRDTDTVFTAFSVNADALYAKAEKISDAGGAVRAYEKEIEEKKSRKMDWDSYSNGQGHFYHKGLQVVACLPGKDVLGGPCVWMVRKESPENVKWYIDATRIVIETCEYALKNEGCTLTWSA